MSPRRASALASTCACIWWRGWPGVSWPNARRARWITRGAPMPPPEPIRPSTANAHQQAAPSAPIEVLFALLPDSLALDWAGPAEALRMANQALQAQGLPPRFVLRFVGPCAEQVSSVGLRLSGIEALPTTLDKPSWLVLVGLPGQTIATTSEPTRALLHWLRGLRLHTQQLELITVCAGSVLAAHAGLLARHHVTTHHHHLAELQTVEPSCHVVANRVF